MTDEPQALFEIDDTLSVRELGQRFAKMLRREFRSEVWGRGQIRDLSRPPSGHVYFNLVEPVEGGRQPDALVRVVLFDTAKQIVNRLLTRSGAGRFEDGMEIRIRGEVDYYAPQGSLQIRMTSIDPEYTLGRLAADRDHLLRTLAAEGLMGRNAQLPHQLVPLRIALITSAGSAAAADFTDQLDATGYAWDVTIYDSRMQGVTAAESVSRAVMLAGRQTPPHDVICVVRGGGARTDLSTFDAEPIARAIATSPVPVYCGIGHEIDRSIADEVAALSLKTPTACAQVLIDTVTAADARFFDLGARIAQLARRRPAEHQAELERCSNRLLTAAGRATDHENDRMMIIGDRISRSATRSHRHAAARVDTHAAELAPAAQRCIDRRTDEQDALAGAIARTVPRALRGRGTELDAIEARVRALDPVHVLRRGWSITTGPDGRAVTSIENAPSTLHTRIADGTLISTVTDRRPADDLGQEGP